MKLGPGVSLHHYRYWNSYIGCQSYTELYFTFHTLSTQKPTYLVNLLHFSDISTTLRSSDSKQRFVPKTNLNIGKLAFSVTLLSIWNQLPITITFSKTIDTFRKKKLITYICLKLVFHYTFSAFPTTKWFCFYASEL